MKSFLKAIATQARADPRPINLQLSAITFSETPREEFLFTSTLPILDSIDAIQYIGHNPANVNRGLMLAKEKGFTGSRPNVPRVVLLLTQGVKPEYNQYVETVENEAYEQANLLRSEGVRILAVGASLEQGESDEQFLSNISEDNYWQTADSEEAIVTVLHQITMSKFDSFYRQSLFLTWF